MTKPLSTTAQAVFWDFNSKFDWIEDGVPGPQFKAIAAALRAINEYVVMPLPRYEYDYDELEVISGIHQEIERLAEELEETK